MKNVIFFNIGWMINYRGQTSRDELLGDFKYIKNNGTGNEQYNFLPSDGYCYGYAPVPSLDLTNLGGDKDSEKLNNVTVIFFSRDKNRGEAYIVGWYRNATVYRSLQKREGKDTYYICKARKEDGVCVKEHLRTFRIPSAHKEKGGYGQSPVWYAKARPDLKEKALHYIDNFGSDKRKSLSRFQLDQEKKRDVEQNAIELVCEYFRGYGFEVESFEAQNVGYDLVAARDEEEWFIEVKGMSGNEPVAQLTPNEYQTLKKYWKKYIIAIVTNALRKEEIKLNIFSFDGSMDEENKYYIGHNDEGDLLVLEERISAVGYLRE